MPGRRAAVAVLAAAAFVLLLPAAAGAQYFGQNKVQYENLDFRVLRTEHFDIYFYPEEEAAVKMAARMAERWRTRIGRVLGYQLSGRQPLVLFASHPHFRQTGVIEGLIDPGTGGVTEGLQRRVVMPFAATLGDTDHVLGHEIVHAFQYDMLGRNAAGVPLWFIEGMAEYLSVGPTSAHTAMWLRDAALAGRFPDIPDLGSPEYFPYRFGHAFWAYIGGRFGDNTIGRIMLALAESQPGQGYDYLSAIEQATGRDIETLSKEWRSAVGQMYGIDTTRPEREEQDARPGVIDRHSGGGRVNIGPSLSPDGSLVAFLSERGRLSIEVYIADGRTGEVLRKVTETAVDPHFQNLEFLASAGSWSPTSDRLAIAAVREGRPVIALIDARSGSILREFRFEQLGEIFQPAWSPDGRFIAFSGLTGGMTDLYVHEIETGETRRLTNDPFADVQPVWSPDGRRLAFVTDRFTSNLDRLEFGDSRIGIIDVASQAIQPLQTGHRGDQMNPQWSSEGGEFIYFLSTHDGTQDVYRVPAAGGTPEPVTAVATGVTGITDLSQALSVAGGRMAATLFWDSGYEIHLLDARPNALANGPTVRTTSDLPPAEDRGTIVRDLLDQPGTGLPPEGQFTEEEYDSSLRLLQVGQALGASVGGSFGTQAYGGLSLIFSDVLGNHLLGTTFLVNGSAQDIGGQAFYLNRARRWNWGLVGEHVPQTAGFASSGVAEVNGTSVFVEQLEIFRQTNSQAGALVAYPFSRASRVEFSGAVRRIGFSREIERRIFSLDTGNLISDETFDLAAPAAINIIETTAAFVRDTAAFGPVGPLVGQRLRLDVTPMAGDLRMTSLTADVRQYLMPMTPVTIAVRGVHFGRYGQSAEDPRLSPLFIGYSTLVRGYDVNTFRLSECTLTPDGSCPEFNRLLGSRMLVGNLEVRAPAVGLFRGRLDYGPIPVEMFAFADTGVAWTSDEKPRFAGGVREFVSSVGVGARVNLFGFAITEFNLARPLNRERGWIFVFNLRPGF